MAPLSHQSVQALYDQFGELKVLDDVIQHRAADEIQVPILGYPRFEQSVDDYELFTGKQLSHFIDMAAEKLITLGLKPNGRGVIGLLAPSNLDFVVSFFALSRLGYTILTLSLRISPVAVSNLLKQCNCNIIIHGSSRSIETTLEKVKNDLPLKPLALPSRGDYDIPASQTLFVREFDREGENGRLAIIIHSSGSTGLPKPIGLSHRAILCHPPVGSGLHNFNALPWYHVYGISTSLQAIWMGKIAHLFNTSLPLTGDNLIAVIEAVRPEAIHSVPYALGLLAEKPRGIELLKECKVVTAAGARTPDELGDRLIKAGVQLGVVFGTTEAGLLGDTMRREKGDDSWNYIRIYPNIREYVWMKPLGDNLYECVYLKGHPPLSTSNSDDPPGSWHSKDVFVPHVSIPDVWKYITRIDDRITLINGEKVLPLPIEGRLRQDRLIREAAVVGIDRAIPGLLVFRSHDGDMITEENDYIDAIWPSVADANSRAESFSQITREMITPIGSNVEYPQTDKGSIIRSQVYEKFADEIGEMYNKLEGNKEGGLKLDLPAIEEYLVKTFQSVLGVPLVSLDTDFFSIGIDSLKAIQMRRVIQKSLDLNGTNLSPNVIYECGNAKSLARYLYTLGQGENAKKGDKIVLMNELIEKYSEFENHHRLNGALIGALNGAINGDAHMPSFSGQCVILTGATGSLGAHLLAQLVGNSDIKTVYCLVRGSKPAERIKESLKERKIEHADFGKVVAIAADLSQPGLGLNSSILAELREEVSLIMHIAWPVNFNLRLKSFEPHIAGLHNLIQFSLSVKRSTPAQLFFCSSISAAFNTPTPAIIPEAVIEDFSRAANTGYAQSKFVGEHIVQNSRRFGALSYVVRVGQIVGDTRNGVWNDKEFVPLILRSALTLKALPGLQEDCSWLPVNTVASVIIEISDTLATSSPTQIDTGDFSGFYNITNPHIFAWEDVLNELRNSGVKFDTVPRSDWLEKLRISSAQETEVDRNPAVKLIEYFESPEGLENGEIIFDTTAAQRDSAALRSAPDIIKEGYLRSFWSLWMLKWHGDRPDSERIKDE